MVGVFGQTVEGLIVVWDFFFPRVMEMEGK